jgi:hypothetical protein
MTAIASRHDAETPFLPSSLTTSTSLLHNLTLPRNAGRERHSDRWKRADKRRRRRRWACAARDQMPGIFSLIRFWAKLLSGGGQREYTVPFFLASLQPINNTHVIRGWRIISRGQHISRSTVKRVLRFSVLAFRTLTETLGRSREKAAGEKLGKPRIRHRVFFFFKFSFLISKY